MKYSALLLLFLASQIQAADWPLDDITDTFTVRGTAKAASGVSGQSLVLDGTSLIELKRSAQLTGDAFTVSLWFNPYDLAGGQQMLVGKNRYSRNERQWSLTIEPDGKLKAHLRQHGWSTISCDVSLVAGQWYLATLVVQPDQASLFLNGKPAGEAKLQTPIAVTPAPITLGGIWDQENVRQPFHGALDEFSYEPRAWSAKEIAAAYRPVSARHDVPKLTAGLPLWDDAQEVPKAAELPLVQGAEFHVLKQKRPDDDGCRWTLGVGLAWHKGKLYASYGFNKGSENTPTEEAHVRVSRDGGKTWDKPIVVDAGEGNLGVSHGVFLSHGGRLWAFMGAFYDNRQRTHTRAYRLNETSGQWEPHGVVIDRGFWPMQEPQQMADGNWIMAGFRVASGFGQAGNLPAVAISKGKDFTKWDLVVIPAAPNLGSNLWGESTVIVESRRILNIARYGKKAIALLSVSEDHGRNWTPAAPSNLPMATSKPYAGTLSTGQPYLVCTTTADTGGARSPLTIAVGKPGESVFSKVFLIRTSVFEGTPGVSDPKADFSYPYAVEHEGKLYIGYTHKSHVANELAVIPINQLRADDVVPAQRDDASSTQNVDSTLMLAGDWVPKDPHQIDYEKLPRVKAEHTIISDVRDHAGTRVHQHAYLAHHDGRFWAMWSDGPGGPRTGVTAEQHRNIVPAHDMPGTRNSFATSRDGLHWSKPADLTGPPRKKGFGWIARGLWERDGQLLALASHFNAPGYDGPGLSLEAFRWDGTKWVDHGTVLDDSMNNFPPKRLPSGEWMMTRRDHQRQVSVMIGGTKAFNDWRINPLAAYDGNGRPEEPYWYVLPDEKTIVGLIRDNGGSKFLLRTFSRDNGQTWSKIHRTNFPDATSKFFVHRTSRGYYVTVSNSNPRRRDPLTLAISQDGLVFTKLFWLIGGRHVDYPHIIEHDGHLLIAFSGAKQTMEVMKVSLDELERLAMPESVELAQHLPPVKQTPQQPPRQTH